MENIGYIQTTWMGFIIYIEFATIRYGIFVVCDSFIQILIQFSFL